MAMGRRRDRARTPGLWIAANALPPTGGHPFYQRLNQVLDAHAFDDCADQGDTTTIAETVVAAAEDLEAVATVTDDTTAVIEEVVADKGYHSNQVLVDLAALDLRTYIAEPARGRRNWRRKAAARDAVYANRRRIHGARGRAAATPQ